MTKQQLLIRVLMVIGVFLLIVWGYSLDKEIEWNTWVNRVYIAGQPGSNSKVVQQILGKPAIRQPESLAGKLTPPIPVIKEADKVYVYGEFFLFRGVWQAYIFIDASGKVVGFHIAES